MLVDRHLAARRRLRRIFYGLRTEGAGPVAEAAAIGAGVFIGCLPLYGLHLLICWTVGALLRLNRLKMYLAANISNPLVAPWLLFLEVQAGAWLRRGSFHSLTPEAIRSTGAAVYGVDLVVGSLFVGSLLGLMAAAGTYATSRASSVDRRYLEVVRSAADRYVDTSMTAWEFARGKLRGDPVYRTLLFGGVMPSGGTLVDIGCGQGLMLALTAETHKAYTSRSRFLGASAPPTFDRMIGIENRPRVAALARQALGEDAEIIDADASALSLPTGRVFLLLDVLHLMSEQDQERLLNAINVSLEPGGVMLVREADASAGWGFTAVRIGNRLKAIAFGRWRQRFAFRRAGEWVECFRRHGLSAEVHDMQGGTPFANVLFRVTRG